MRRIRTWLAYALPATPGVAVGVAIRLAVGLLPPLWVALFDAVVVLLAVALACYGLSRLWTRRLERQG